MLHGLSQTQLALGDDLAVVCALDVHDAHVEDVDGPERADLDDFVKDIDCRSIELVCGREYQLEVDFFAQTELEVWLDNEQTDWTLLEVDRRI